MANPRRPAISSSSKLPTLDDLRPHLDIAPSNTGLQSPLTTPSGIITDDLEGLHAMTDEYGRIMLQSGVEVPLYAYRGQPEEYTPCFPTLGRLKKSEDQFLALCRNAAFEDAISEHPYVRITEQTTFLGCPLHVDKQGLAQHYGLATDLLDFTSNYEIATFFATCGWDPDSKRFKPITQTRVPGVIYRISPALFTDTNMGVEFETVGWQPLKRPEQQRAFGLRMKKDQDLRRLPPIQKIMFQQCEKISLRTWNFFDKGQSLFPKDAAAELSMRAGTLNLFTQQQIDRAWIRFDIWNKEQSSSAFRQKIENHSDFNICETLALSWDGLDVERDEKKLVKQLGDILNQVRYRRVSYPI